MNLAAFFVTLVIGPIVAGGIIAGLLQSSIRETTGIYERWLYQPKAQQESLLEDIQTIPLDPNESNRDDDSLAPDGDHDGDTITNGDEIAIDYDPRNPDTNGDGTDDRVEVSRGMSLDKTVNGSERIRAKTGEEVEYKMQARWLVTENQPRTLTFLDPKPDGIGMLEGYYEFNSSRVTLQDWPVRLDFPVSARGNYELNIYIKAVVGICKGGVANIATITDSTKPGKNVTDSADILVIPDPTRVLIDKLTKTVNGKHWVEARPGDVLNFEITAVIEFETCDEERTVIIRDIDSGGLDFVAGSARINSDFQSLNRFPSELSFVLRTEGTYTINIRFTAEVSGNQLITNKARALEKDNPINYKEDTVFISMPESGALDLFYLFKEGRPSGSLLWHTYIFANSEDRIEFHIKAEIGSGTFGLKDALPEGLTYVPGTLRLLYDGDNTNSPETFLRGVFNEGIALNRGPGEYDLYFFATVDAVAPFSLTNTAGLLKDFPGNSPTEVATSNATVISK